MEAMYHGVPVVGIPLFIEQVKVARHLPWVAPSCCTCLSNPVVQPYNAQQAEHLGVGIAVREAYPIQADNLAPRHALPVCIEDQHLCTGNNVEVSSAHVACDSPGEAVPSRRSYAIQLRASAHVPVLQAGGSHTNRVGHKELCRQGSTPVATHASHQMDACREGC